jgi:hypothetical protein
MKLSALFTALVLSTSMFVNASDNESVVVDNKPSQSAESSKSKDVEKQKSNEEQAEAESLMPDCQLMFPACDTIFN